jgi:hypothetical protein
MYCISLAEDSREEKQSQMEGGTAGSPSEEIAKDSQTDRDAGAIKIEDRPMKIEKWQNL